MRRIVTRLIPAIQVAGALSAFVALAFGLRSGATFAVLVIVLLVACVYAAGVIGAIRLWRDEEAGRRYSIVHQALILPKLSISGLIIYNMNDIAYFDIGVSTEPGKINFAFDFGLAFNELWFHVLAPSEITYVGLNLVTIAALYCLLTWPRWKERNERVDPNIFN